MRMLVSAYWLRGRGRALVAAAACLLVLMALIDCRSQPEPSARASATPIALAPTSTAESAVAPATPSPPVPAPPTPTLEPTATPSPEPTPTFTSLPTPTPAPLLRQLTGGGCCTQPFWAPDSQQVLFIDKPDPQAPVGIWGVAIDRPLAPPELVTTRIAAYTDDFAYVIEPGRTGTTIERLVDGERWTVATGGGSVSLSPGRTRLAWEVSDDSLPSERRVSQVWVANLDGSQARRVATLPRGGLSGWIDEERLLVSGQETLNSQEQALFALALSDGSQVELARAQRVRGASLSPDGRWLVYMIALNEDETQNGLWLVRTDGSERRPVDRRLFGAYQWRDEGRLLIIPFQAVAPYHEVWELTAETGQMRRLTDPAVTPIKIANGDWRASPDGRHIVFVENRDRNIWLLTLPNAGNDGQSS